MASSRPTLEKPLTDIQLAAAKAVDGGLDTYVAELRAKVPRNRKKTRRFIRKLKRPEKRQGRAGVVFPFRSRVDPDGTVTKQIVSTIWKGIESQVLQGVQREMSEAVRRQRPSFRSIIEARK